MGRGIILYIKSIQTYEIKLEREADCDEAIAALKGNQILGLIRRNITYKKKS